MKFTYETDIGDITIGASDAAITHINLHADAVPGEIGETPLIKEAYVQLCDYLAGVRWDFDLPIEPAGTPFQLSVWRALCDVGYGKTASYKDIARTIGNEKSVRAVGGANNKNPILIVIPCHRIIGSSGDLVGYGGGLPLKKKLLALESQHER